MDSLENVIVSELHPAHDLIGRLGRSLTAIRKDGTQRVSDPVQIEIYRDSLQRIVQTGRLIVGIHADDNPGVFCFNSPDAGYQGFDIDLSKQIARQISEKYKIPYRDPEFRFYHWPELLSGPGSFDVDFIIASISRSPQREATYGLRFSDPYYTTQMGVIVRDGATSDLTYDSLLHMTLAVNATTTASEFAAHLKLTAVKEPTKQEVFALMADGKANGILYDYVRGIPEAASRGWIIRRIDYDTIPARLRPAPEEYAIATAALNDRLLGEINSAIHATSTQAMIDDKIRALKH